MADVRLLLATAYGFNASGAKVLDDITGWSELSYGWALNRGVSLEVTIPKNGDLVTMSNLYPMATALFVLRNNVVVWGGPITAMTVSSDSNQIKIVADDHIDMLKRIRDNSGMSYTNQDVKTLIGNVLGSSQFHLGYPAKYVPNTAWGVTNSVSYVATEFANIGEVIDGLSKSPTKGFDFYMTYSWTSGRILCETTFEFPKRGGSGVVPKEHLWHKVVDGRPMTNLTKWQVLVDGKRYSPMLITTGIDTSGGQLSITDIADWVDVLGGSTEQYTSTDAKFASAGGADVNGGSAIVTWDLYSRSDLAWQGQVNDAGDTRLKQVETPLLFFTGELSSQEFGTWGSSSSGLPTPGDIVKVTIDDGVIDFSEDQRITEVRVSMRSGLSERITVTSSRLTSDIS